MRFILASKQVATDNEYRVPKPQDAEGRIPKGPNFAEGKISSYSNPRKGTEPEGELASIRSRRQDLQLVLRFFGESWAPA
jgi:hypothetical protein